MWEGLEGLRAPGAAHQGPTLQQGAAAELGPMKGVLGPQLSSALLWGCAEHPVCAGAFLLAVQTGAVADAEEASGSRLARPSMRFLLS